MDLAKYHPRVQTLESLLLFFEILQLILRILKVRLGDL